MIQSMANIQTLPDRLIELNQQEKEREKKKSFT